MRLNRLGLGLLLAGSLLASPALARETAERSAPARKERARATKRYELHGVEWHRGTDAALRAAKKKPVLLVRMLGELDGKT